jgi:hypothetical protein
MLMDPNGMDEFTVEWWEMDRMEILQHRRLPLGGLMWADNHPVGNPKRKV